MPTKTYSSLSAMFTDIATYVRKHGVEVFWDDNVNTNMHQITTGPQTWAITRESVFSCWSQAQKDRELCKAMQTAAGKMVLLTALNQNQFAPGLLPPAKPLTAWERILADD